MNLISNLNVSLSKKNSNTFFREQAICTDYSQGNRIGKLQSKLSFYVPNENHEKGYSRSFKNSQDK